MNLWMTLGSAAGFLAVALGAFGAHALQDRLDAYSLSIYQTAVHYHFFHALALLGLGAWQARGGAGVPPWVGFAFAGGILIFSGSLYALAFTGIKILGAVTPLGGTAFLAAWAGLFYYAGLKGGVS